MMRANTRLRLVVWAVVAALVAQCLFVWLALRSFRSLQEQRFSDVELRLSSAYSSAASNAVDRLLASLPASIVSPVQPDGEDAPAAPRPRLLGVGRNGYYDYLDIVTADETGVETTRRIYRRSPRPDPRSPRERRPPGY